MQLDLKGHWFVMQLLGVFSAIGGKESKIGAVQFSLPPPTLGKILEQAELEPVEQVKPSPSPPHHHHHEGPTCSTPHTSRIEPDGLREPEDLLDQESFAYGDSCVAVAPPSLGQQGAEARFTPVGLLRVRPPLPAPVFEDLGRDLSRVFDDSRSASPSLSLASNSSLSRQLCCGITRTGKQCKKRAILGQDYCHCHAEGYTSYNRP